MAIRDGTKFTVEYGIQTPTSKTILGVTEDLEEAQRTSRSVSGAELGVRRLWRFVARSEAGRPTLMCRVLTLLAARGQTGSGGTASGSGSADREVTGKPVRG